jgi:hypothetical protein
VFALLFSPPTDVFPRLGRPPKLVPGHTLQPHAALEAAHGGPHVFPAEIRGEAGDAQIPRRTPDEAAMAEYFQALVKSGGADEHARTCEFGR